MVQVFPQSGGIAVGWVPSLAWPLQIVDVYFPDKNSCYGAPYFSYAWCHGRIFGCSFGWVLFWGVNSHAKRQRRITGITTSKKPAFWSFCSSLQGILKSSLGAGGALAPALFFGLWGQRPPENVLGPCDCTEMEQPLGKITCRLGGPVWRLRYKALSCLCQWCACRCGCQHDLCSESTAWLVAERRWSNVGWDRGFSSTAGSCTPKFYHMLLFLCCWWCLGLTQFELLNSWCDCQCSQPVATRGASTVSSALA